jgi:hypothetical protein
LDEASFVRSRLSPKKHEHSNILELRLLQPVKNVFSHLTQRISSNKITRKAFIFSGEKNEKRPPLIIDSKDRVTLFHEKHIDFDQVLIRKNES